MSARRSTLADLLSDVPDENRGIYRRLLSKLYRRAPTEAPTERLQNFLDEWRAP